MREQLDSTTHQQPTQNLSKISGDFDPTSEGCRRNCAEQAPTVVRDGQVCSHPTHQCRHRPTGSKRVKRFLERNENCEKNDLKKDKNDILNLKYLLFTVPTQPIRFRKKILDRKNIFHT